MRPSSSPKKTAGKRGLFRKRIASNKQLNQSFKYNKKYVESLKENNAALVNAVAAQKLEIGKLKSELKHRVIQHCQHSILEEKLKAPITRAYGLIKKGVVLLSDHTTLILSALEELGAVLEHPSHSRPTQEQQQSSSSSHQDHHEREQSLSPFHPAQLQSVPPDPEPQSVLLPQNNDSTSDLQKLSVGAGTHFASPTPKGAAKPMVQGHTISTKPTVSLHRMHLPLRLGKGGAVQPVRGMVVSVDNVECGLPHISEESDESGQSSPESSSVHENELGISRMDDSVFVNGNRSGGEELECNSPRGRQENDGSDHTSDSEDADEENLDIHSKGVNHEDLTSYQNTRNFKNPSASPKSTGKVMDGKGRMSRPQVVLHRLDARSGHQLPLSEEILSPIDIDDAFTSVNFGSMGIAEALLNHEVERSSCDVRTSSNVGVDPACPSDWGMAEWTDDTSSDDECDSNLALQIVESRKSYLQHARQAHLKEGTSWNYDSKGNYQSNPIKKRGRKAKSTKSKSSAFSNVNDNNVGDQNVTLPHDDLNERDMTFTQPVPGVIIVGNAANSRQSCDRNLSSPGNRETNLVPERGALTDVQHPELQVSLARLADDYVNKGSRNRTMYVTQRGSKERAVKHSHNEARGKESYSPSGKPCSPRNTPLKDSKALLESSLKKSRKLSKYENASPRKITESLETSNSTHQLKASAKSCDSSVIEKGGGKCSDYASPGKPCSPGASRNTPLKDRKALLESSLKKSRKLSKYENASPRKMVESLETSDSTHQLSASPKPSFDSSAVGIGGQCSDYASFVVLERLPVPVRRKHYKACLPTISLSPACDEDKAAFPRKSLSSSLSCAQSPHPVSSPLPSPTGFTGGIPNKNWNPQKKNNRNILDTSSDDDDDDNYYPVQLAKRKLKSNKLSLKKQSKRRCKNSESAPDDRKASPVEAASSLTKANVNSLPSERHSYAVSDGDLSSTSSDMLSMRPRRTKAPTNLKEPSLTKKMRR